MAIFPCPFSKLVAERAVVDEQVRICRELCEAFKRSRVARVHDFPPLSKRPHNILRLHNSAVLQLDFHAFLKLRPRRTFFKAKRLRFLGKESSRPRLFNESVRETLDNMV